MAEVGTGVAIVAAAVVLGGAVAHAVGKRRGDRVIRDLCTSLEADCAGESLPASNLPDAIRAFALKNGASDEAAARTVRFTQECEMMLNGKWQPMRAEQLVGVRRPGFVWDAHVLSWMRVRVVDAYVGGRGILAARLFGSIQVAHATGPVFDRGEAMRYIAEIAWAPDAILHCGAVQWRALSEHNVYEAALEVPNGDGKLAVVQLRLDSNGDIVEMNALDRPATKEGGGVELLHWRGKFQEYQEMGGRRVPTRGEVGYVREGTGYEQYWRGSLTSYAVE